MLSYKHANHCSWYIMALHKINGPCLLLSSFIKNFSILFKQLLSTFHQHSITYVVRIYFSAMTVFINIKDMQRTYGQKIEARTLNFCFCGKAISITHSECVSVASGIQHELRMCHIFICGLSPNYPINGTIFEKKNVFEHKTCVLGFSIFVWSIFQSKKN